jgi:hypothetical protein
VGVGLGLGGCRCLHSSALPPTQLLFANCTGMVQQFNVAERGGMHGRGGMPAGATHAPLHSRAYATLSAAGAHVTAALEQMALVGGVQFGLHQLTGSTIGAEQLPQTEKACL